LTRASLKSWRRRRSQRKREGKARLERKRDEGRGRGLNGMLRTTMMLLCTYIHEMHIDPIFTLKRRERELGCVK